MNIPEGWKGSLLAEMERRFEVTREKGRLHDDALSIDDTQLGVEFAMDFIDSLLATAQTPPSNSVCKNSLPTPPAQRIYTDCSVVCRASRSDGVICPDDSCDIEDGVRSATPPAQEFVEHGCASNPVVEHEPANMSDKAQEDEPIGILYRFVAVPTRNYLTKWCYDTLASKKHHDNFGNIETVVIYTRLQYDNLRKAAEEVIKAFDNAGEVRIPYKFLRNIEDLRAELEGKS